MSFEIVLQIFVPMNMTGGYLHGLIAIISISFGLTIDMWIVCAEEGEQNFIGWEEESLKIFDHG